MPLLLLSSKTAEIPQNLHKKRKQENSDKLPSDLPHKRTLYGLSQPLANPRPLNIAKMDLKRGGYGSRIGWRIHSAGQETWYRQLKVTLYHCLGNTALRHQRLRCQKPSMSWKKVTGRERNETVFINSGSLRPSSRTPPPLPYEWGHWHISWWAWNSPSRLVHTNGPLNP